MGSFGKIVVGCDIRALAYAYKLNLPLIYTRPLEPFFLDRFSSTGGGKEILKSPDGGIPVGRLKAKEWQKYYFLLSLSGMVIYGDSVQSIFIEKKTLSVGRKNLRRKTLEFENLIIFDDYGVNGLPDMIDQVDRKNIIYDWVNVHNGHTHDYDIIQTNSDFVNSINFYTSNRGGNPNVRDIILVSYLTDDETKDFSYSGTMAKFKTLDVLKSHGIKGRRNGRNVKNPHKYKYYAIKLDPAHRRVVSRKKNIYKDTGNIQFNNDSIEEINRLVENHAGFLKKVAKIV